MKKMKKLASIFLVFSMIITLLTPIDYSVYAAESKKVKVGETVTLKTSKRGKKVTWKTSNKKIATVSKNGEVKGISPGKATITAKIVINGSKNTTEEFKITVVKEDESEKYIVTFETNGGSEINKQTVNKGDKISKPENPTKEGYLFVGWYSDKALKNEYDFSLEVTKDMTLYAKWEEDNANYCTVDYILMIDDKAVNNCKNFQDYRIKKGKTIKKPIEPISDLAKFAGWYSDLQCIEEFDFSNPITEDVTLYAKWNVDTTDTDNDGIYDVSEEYRGSNPNSKDTDNDGLNDYQEILVETDFNIKDTDGNGIIDYDEDYDEDGLTNGEEGKLGTSLTVKDTDYDDLDDYSENYIYNTNPLKADSDGDGANDGWEVNNGYDPLKHNDTFTAKIKPENPTEMNPVSAGVELYLSGKNASTLSVEPVSSAQSPMLTPSIAGYLGSAYNFTVDGEVDEATLVFKYDETLGTIGDEFQPRIYYFNESEGILEELENQTVTEGCVKATVTHFSSYILLNKVEFDKVWENEIKPPDSEVETEDAVLDVAFVIDYSASMEENDPDQLCKQLSKEFVSKLRDDIDRAAVVQFIRKATLLSPLTADKDALEKAIDSIVYDSGYRSDSGTDGSAGIHLALEQLSSSKSQYKYIVFVTDGQDNGYSYSYDDLITSAIDSGVNIYTVGMGNASEDVLRKVADRTGGKYYHATTSAAADDVLNLDEVFEEIKSETIDYTTDSNNDGISDYYTKLIKDGELVLSNGSMEFTGIDFNNDKDGKISADFDGDGVRNGDELIIQQVKQRDGKVVVCMKMNSDPLKKYSDADIFDDSEERENNSNPLIADYNGDSVGLFKKDDWLYYNQIVELYDTDSYFRVEQALFGAELTDGFEKISKKKIIDYFYDYAKSDNSKDSVEQQYTQAYKITSIIAEMDNNIISKLVEYIQKSKEAADEDEKIREAAKLIADYKELGSQMHEISVYDSERYEQGVIEKMQELIEQKYVDIIDQTMKLESEQNSFDKICLKINNFHSKYKTFMDKKLISDITMEDTFTLVELGSNIADGIITVSKVNAATEIFEQNFDILDKIRNNAKYEEVSNAAQEVLYAMGKGATSYYEECAKVVAKESVDVIIDEFLDKVLKENPVYVGYKIAMGVLKLTGADKTPISVYNILCYSSMIDATQNLIDTHMKRNEDKNLYSVEENKVSDAVRYLTNAAQICIKAEKEYIDLSNTDKVHDEYAEKNIDILVKKAKIIRLTLSKKLLKECTS